jgi:hypothetical protein
VAAVPEWIAYVALGMFFTGAVVWALAVVLIPVALVHVVVDAVRGRRDRRAAAELAARTACDVSPS